MPKHKRNNMATHNGNMETIVVGMGDQPLAQGSLVDGTSTYNLAPFQFGVLSWDFNGTNPLGDFIAPGTVVTDVDAIKFLQGTPVSPMTQDSDVWEVSHRDRVESGIIRREGVRSISTVQCKASHFSAHAFTDLPPFLNDTEYLTYIDLDGVREDKRYGDSSGTISEVLETPNFINAGIIDGMDWTVQHMLHKVNSRSRLATLSNTAAVQRGNRDLISFAINSAGGAGTAIGAITCGDVIPVQIDYGVFCGTPTSPVTTNIIADKDLIATLACVLKNQADQVAAGATVTNQITAASTIEIIDLTTAGAAPNVNSMIFIGLHSKKAAYSDNVMQVTNNIHVELSEGFRVYPLFHETCCMADEGTNQGWKWTIDSDDRYQLGVHTMQNHPFFEYFSKGMSYIDASKDYTAYIIDYSDYEETLSFEMEYPKQLIILLECTCECTDVATAEGELANSGMPFVPVTTDAATVADLNAIFGAWLESARMYTNHDLLGMTTPATYFV